MNGTGGMVSTVKEEMRQTAAMEIMESLEETDSLAESVLAAFQNKLSCVMMERRDGNKLETCDEPVREYPPYFGDVRLKIESIQHALRQLSDGILRVEFP